uniref:(northern house mosquito) hypothetical protein n=1 Tax=Culex pipiens TaxID=7175 RepID=A0A8D8GSZ6_CULPI
MRQEKKRNLVLRSSFNCTLTHTVLHKHLVGVTYVLLLERVTTSGHGFHWGVSRIRAGTRKLPTKCGHDQSTGSAMTLTDRRDHHSWKFFVCLETKVELIGGGLSFDGWKLGGLFRDLRANLVRKFIPTCTVKGAIRGWNR